MTVYRARRHLTSWSFIALLLAAVIVGGVLVALFTRQSHQSNGPAGESGCRPAHRGEHDPAHGSDGAAAQTHRCRTNPSSGSIGISATSTITVTLTAPLTASSALPTLSPPIAGTWHDIGNELTFTPTAPLLPLIDMTLTIPGGDQGLRAQGGSTLASSVAVHFRVENGSVLRLQQLLSLLDYSPLSWTPTTAAIAPKIRRANRRVVPATTGHVHLERR